MPQEPAPSSPTQEDSQDPGIGLRGVVPSRWTPNAEPFVEDSQAEEDVLAPPSPTPAQRRLSPIAPTSVLNSWHRASSASTFSLGPDHIAEYERRIAHLEGEVHALRQVLSFPSSGHITTYALARRSLLDVTERLLQAHTYPLPAAMQTRSGPRTNGRHAAYMPSERFN
ncbi:hypothetical protein BDN72DRAFT_891914 [Pluteus cervinus]|uniref:Uncharacterized protein n=1 Tax=Pluteus cervinus TaxID=181527 RepID=A0ACD3BD12_9AGAR|nr:hypothetical protein BDN72DRAFT_891914 [Pluteus cervinus]